MSSRQSQQTPDSIILGMHRELGIPESYGDSCALAFCPECDELVPTETDVFDRQPYMAAAAFAAWQAMQASAAAAGITLQIVSAYRSAKYQKGLIRRKLEQGQAIADILRVNAAPGYSEHHSGCAVDITTPDFEPLAEVFEDSEAFAWLQQHAGEFGFSLSFPRDNAAGMTYEPWHWKFSPAN